MDGQRSGVSPHVEDLREARYHAAWTRLNDVAGMVALECRVADVHPERSPQAIVLAGKHLLRSGSRIGMLSGSFNPLTHAHVAVAEAAVRALQLDVVVWAIAAVTIDKERTLRASVPDRLAQLIAFAASEQRAAVALINHGLYVEQARAMRAQVRADAKLMLLVGYDKIVQILDPHYYTDRDTALNALFRLAHLAVFPRAGAGERELHQLMDVPLNVRFARHVSYVDLPPTVARDSSTEVRTLAAQTSRAAESMHTLIPPEAAALVDTGPYYAGPPGGDRYAWRQRWLGKLLALPQASIPHLPDLDSLIAQTMEQTARGERLCGWLVGETTSHGEAPGAELERLLRSDLEAAK